MAPLIACACLLPLLYYLRRLYSQPSSSKLPLPPGPPGLPLVRNLFDWPSQKCEEIFAQWAATYGDIVHANVLGADMVMINSAEIATDLLNRKGSIYSDRPHMHFLNETIGWRDSFVMMNDGPELKEQRRLFAQAIGTKTALERFAPILDAQTSIFIQRILADPATLLRYIWVLTGAIILDTTYGYQIKGTDDKLITLAENVVRDFAVAGVPGAYMVDTLPWLDRLPEWLPGTGYRKFGAECRQRLTEFVEQPFQYAKDCVAAGTARLSMVSINLENEASHVNEHVLKWCSSLMYAGGTDTSVSAIYAFFCLMAIHPDIQARAQAEIDRVIGTARLPTLRDQDMLPYVNALISEVLRFGQIIPQGVAHLLREDDVYNGYHIPKGTIVMANSQFMSRDVRNYEKPEVFNPDRFLGDNSELDPRAYVFGFGRRACPGRVLGEAMVFLVVSKALATLNILKLRDENGKEITPALEYEDGVVTIPKSFLCDIKARSARSEELLREATES